MQFLYILHIYSFTSIECVFIYVIEVGMSYADKSELFPIQILNMKGNCVVEVPCAVAHTNERDAFYFKPFERARFLYGLWN